jgi:hypothetical protein
LREYDTTFAVFTFLAKFAILSTSYYYDIQLTDWLLLILARGIISAQTVTMTYPRLIWKRILEHKFPTVTIVVLYIIKSTSFLFKVEPQTFKTVVWVSLSTFIGIVDKQMHKQLEAEEGKNELGTQLTR